MSLLIEIDFKFKGVFHIYGNKVHNLYNRPKFVTYVNIENTNIIPKNEVWGSLKNNQKNSVVSIFHFKHRINP